MKAIPATDPLASFRSKRDIWTVSNIISMLRAVLAIPAVVAVMDGHHFRAALIFTLAYISDLLDGYVARKFNDVSEFGKIVDPLADKVFVGAVVIAMLLAGLLPLWFILAVLGRDLLIVVAGIWASKKFGVVLPSNYPGKGAVLTISLTLFLLMLGVSTPVLVFMEALSVALMLLSLVMYGNRLAALLRSV